MSNLITARLMAFLLLWFFASSALAQSENPTPQQPNRIKVTRPDKTTYAHRVIEVVWEVAKSDEESIRASTVDIVLLSKDGDGQVETTLASQTPNDGGELVSIPSGQGEDLRIRVSTADGTGIGVSPSDFKIASAGKSIFLVRHAEKLSGNNPSLSETGQRRAKKLASILKPLGVTHVFSTKYKRTQETAAPSAADSKIEIQHYAKLEQLKEMIDKTPDDAKILIVGHSNTVGPTSAMLGGDSLAIEEGEYENFVVLDYQSGKSEFKLLKFNPDPPASNAKGSTPIQSEDAGKKNR